MFELVDSQPSHLVSVDAINLTPGQSSSCSFSLALPTSLGLSNLRPADTTRPANRVFVARKMILQNIYTSFSFSIFQSYWM